MTPDLQFAILVVHRELSSLDISKGTGPDDIYPQMAHWLADCLAEPLSKLFANCLAMLVVPSYWGLVIIYPVHKKGDPEGVSNYHSLNLTSITCKVFGGP